MQLRGDVSAGMKCEVGTGVSCIAHPFVSVVRTYFVVGPAYYKDFQSGDQPQSPQQIYIMKVYGTVLIISLLYHQFQSFFSFCCYLNRVFPGRVTQTTFSKGPLPLIALPFLWQYVFNTAISEHVCTIEVHQVLGVFHPVSIVQHHPQVLTVGRVLLPMPPPAPWKCLSQHAGPK